MEDIENCACQKRTMALVSMPSEHIIRLEILKSSMSTALWHQDLKAGVFKVDSDYCFLSFDLGFQGKRIRKGSYSYLEDSQFITIDFHNVERCFEEKRPDFPS